MRRLRGTFPRRQRCKGDSGLDPGVRLFGKRSHKTDTQGFSCLNTSRAEILHAIMADAGEAELALGHLAAAAAFGYAFQTFGNFHIHQIDDSVAFLTDEVDVGVGVAIKPLHSFDCGHADRQTLLLEQVQVPVDRAHRQVRDLSLQLSKDSFRGGMIGYGLQILQDRIPLPKMLRRNFHVVTS